MASDNSLKLSKFEKGKAPTLLKIEEANKVRDFIGSVLDTTIDINIEYQDRTKPSKSTGEYSISKNNAKLTLDLKLPLGGGGGGGGSVGEYDEIADVYHIVNGSLYKGTFLIRDQTAV